MIYPEDFWRFLYIQVQGNTLYAFREVPSRGVTVDIRIEFIFPKNSLVKPSKQQAYNLQRLLCFHYRNKHSSLFPTNSEQGKITINRTSCFLNIDLIQ